jgi:hypothetical protein
MLDAFIIQRIRQQRGGTLGGDLLDNGLGDAASDSGNSDSGRVPLRIEIPQPPAPAPSIRPVAGGEGERGIVDVDFSI